MNVNITTVSLLVWSIFAGIILAAIYISLQASTISLFIQKLLENKCFDASSAKDLHSLGINSGLKKRIIYGSVKGQNGLRRVIGAVLESGDVLGFGEQPKAVYSDGVKFFTDRDCTELTLKKYSYKKSNPFSVAVLAVLLALVAAASTVIIPFLSGYASRTFSNTSSALSSASSSTSTSVNDESKTDKEDVIIDENTNFDNRQDESFETGTDSDTKNTADSESVSGGTANIPTPNIPTPSNP